MKQLLATGWMHNRVRMIVASFLVKDLHVPWQWGAKFFMDHLIDGDLASNNHGWQWTAGTGTDAAPYFRVFNPTSQSEKFDPEGEYLRQWIPEIAHLDKKSIHDPSSLGLLAPADYVEPIVDHAVERVEALARYKAVSGK
jgi:deoxyribodipyrimidine photo-lyase